VVFYVAGIAALFSAVGMCTQAKTALDQVSAQLVLLVAVVLLCGALAVDLLCDIRARLRRRDTDGAAQELPRQQ
jgi:hypothetical protein